MAQSGCFVPAINDPQPMFRVADSIFSRVGMSDSIECNASTFAMEMKEMAYILNNLGDSSLVIIDELGKDFSICSQSKNFISEFNKNSILSALNALMLNRFSTNIPTLGRIKIGTLGFSVFGLST